MRNIDLFGWQTTFAVSYPVVNAAIVEAKSTPPTFDFGDDKAGLHMSGTWGDWQLGGAGAGHNLQLVCPITTGTAQVKDESPVDLSGGSVTIQVNLELVPDPDS